jgi:hypothetical protein
MGVPDAPRTGTLGFSGMGLAVPERARPLRALRPRRAGQAPQEANRLGTTDAAFGKALVARAGDRGRGRLRIRLHKATGRLPALLAKEPVTFVTRLRLDAALYEPAPPRKPKQMGRPRLKGKRLPTLAAAADAPGTIWRSVTVANWYGKGARTVEVASSTAIWYHTGLPPVPLRWVLVRDPQEEEFALQALLCTDLTAEPVQILSWFVLRWQMEATFQEARRHLGVETQRQWSELAIRRTTPALLGLFSFVTLFAHQRMVQQDSDALRQAAWYRKDHPTFSDALAVVRRELWAEETFRGSAREADMVKVPREFVERLTETLCYAA